MKRYCLFSSFFATFIAHLVKIVCSCKSQDVSAEVELPQFNFLDSQIHIKFAYKYVPPSHRIYYQVGVSYYTYEFKVINCLNYFAF